MPGCLSSSSDVGLLPGLSPCLCVSLPAMSVWSQVCLSVCLPVCAVSVTWQWSPSLWSLICIFLFPALWAVSKLWGNLQRDRRWKVSSEFYSVSDTIQYNFIAKCQYNCTRNVLFDDQTLSVIFVCLDQKFLWCKGQQTCAYTHTLTHTHMHTLMHTHMQHTHTHTNARTHTDTTHTHTRSFIDFVVFLGFDYIFFSWLWWCSKI